jgi:UPF0755 protein
MRSIKLLITIVLVVMGSSLAWLAWYSVQPLVPPSLPQQFAIVPGSSLNAISLQLAKAGIVEHPLAFRILGRLMGKAQSIKAGVYTIDAPISPVELYRKMQRGEVTLAAIRFIEGWNINEVRAALDDNSELKHFSRGLSQEELKSRLGISEPSLEGIFFPDTYYFNPDSPDLDVLRHAYREQREKLDKAWQTRAPDLPYQTPYDALIMASIIEKETGSAQERPLIAAVFVNRLKIGMRLQTDPTVIYGMGDKFDGNLRKIDLERDTPYNTYTRKGLPPTPISMPGAASIEAALHPAQSRALYFVSRGDGTHVFSDNLAEHNRAVDKYQRK